MRRQVTSVGGACVLAIILAGCGFLQGSTAQPAPPRTPAPLPSGATALTLPTASPAAEIPVPWACADDTVADGRVARRGNAVAYIGRHTGQPIDLVWPRGFSAWLLHGRAEIAAPDGTVVFHEGDDLSGRIGGVSLICSVDDVFYPPAS